MSTNRRELAKGLYKAFMTGDRKFYEDHLSDDFVFSSPSDVGLNRADTLIGAGREPDKMEKLSMCG